MQAGTTVAKLEAPLHAALGALKRQIVLRALDDAYRLADVPRNDGLLETNFLVLRLHEPGIGPFLQTWWQEIDAHSRRDQLSVGWALRQTGLRIAPLLPPSRSLRDHDDFSYFAHDR